MDSHGSRPPAKASPSILRGIPQQRGSYESELRRMVVPKPVPGTLIPADPASPPPQPSQVSSPIRSPHWLAGYRRRLIVTDTVVVFVAVLTSHLLGAWDGP